MSALDDTFNPATLARSDTVTSTATTKAPSSAVKSSKQSQNYPRVDFEPLYAELKSLIADNWVTYYDALTRFIRGELSANEFADLCDHFILVNPPTEHAHNTLICAIICNVGRDLPEPGTAAWVSAATDKSGGLSSSKTAVASDANEQRLKTEIMALPARERRRLKTILNDGKLPGSGTIAANEEESAASLRSAMEQYHSASRIRAPQVPASSGAGTKTNWDIEIRKRYTQPLYAETREFPDANTVLARIVPICYEESIPSGTTSDCAELTTIATETFFKNFVQEIVTRVRVNGPRYENGSAQGVMTASYIRTVLREEVEVKSGHLQRDRDNELLPVESKAARLRKPIGIADLKMANRVGPSLWNGMPTMGAQVTHNPFDIDIDEWYAQREREGFGSFSTQINDKAFVHAQTNGSHVPKNDEDEMDLEDDDDDDEDNGWEGAGAADREQLRGALNDLLAAPA